MHADWLARTLEAHAAVNVTSSAAAAGLTSAGTFIIIIHAGKRWGGLAELSMS